MNTPRPNVLREGRSQVPGEPALSRGSAWAGERESVAAPRLERGTFPDPSAATAEFKSGFVLSARALPPGGSAGLPLFTVRPIRQRRIPQTAVL